MVTIRPFLDVPGVRAGIEEIFFAASATQSFPTDQAKSAFLERWLGRYLAAYPAEAFVAVADDGQVAGYLVGCLDDPAGAPAFRDIGYFESFKALTKCYPAHIHINTAPQYRNHGIGARLIETFAGHAAVRGSPGMHAVTADGSRNNPFYLKCGFIRAATTEVSGHGLVFFARALTPAPAG